MPPATSREEPAKAGASMKFMGYDNDGLLDVFQTHGSMVDNINLHHSEERLRQPNLMYRNLGTEKSCRHF